MENPKFEKEIRDDFHAIEKTLRENGAEFQLGTDYLDAGDLTSKNLDAYKAMNDNLKRTLFAQADEIERKIDNYFVETSELSSTLLDALTEVLRLKAYLQQPNIFRPHAPYRKDPKSFDFYPYEDHEHDHDAPDKKSLAVVKKFIDDLIKLSENKAPLFLSFHKVSNSIKTHPINKEGEAELEFILHIFKINDKYRITATVLHFTKINGEDVIEAYPRGRSSQLLDPYAKEDTNPDPDPFPPIILLNSDPRKAIEQIKAFHAKYFEK